MGQRAHYNFQKLVITVSFLLTRRPPRRNGRTDPERSVPSEQDSSQEQDRMRSPDVSDEKRGSERARVSTPEGRELRSSSERRNGRRQPDRNLSSEKLVGEEKNGNGEYSSHSHSKGLSASTPTRSPQNPTRSRYIQMSNAGRAHTPVDSTRKPTRILKRPKDTKGEK